MKRWFVLVLRMHLHPPCRGFLNLRLDAMGARGGWLLAARAGV